MDDYKELVEKLRMAGRWIKHDDGSEETYLLSVADCAEIADAIEQLVIERDAAIHDLDMAVCGQESYPCGYCANYGIKPIDVEDVCETCTDCENWEWRGVQNADS